MKRQVFIGNKELIKNKALVCVPIMGENKALLDEEILKINKDNIDIIEWRIDGLAEDFADLYKHLKDALAPLPIIITYRTKLEGGMGEKISLEYKNLVEEIISLKPDAVDVEISGEYSYELINKAKSENITTIASYHNFKYTEDNEQILNKIERMKEAGADIYKLALMPNSFEDTLRILSLTNKLNETDFPVLIISMGELGKLSRIACNQTGAPFTFASALKGSAPGQMEAGFVKSILENIK